MTQEQLDALLAQIGGAGLSHAPAAETKKVPNPAAKANGGSSWTAPEEITVQIQRWHDPATGRVVEAYQGQGGTWVVTRNGTDKALVNVGAAPGEQVRTAPPPTPGQQANDRDAQILQQQREKNAALPQDQDPRYETDEARARRAESTIAAQGQAARTAQQDAERQASRPDKETGSRQVTDANGQTTKVTTYQRPDGTTYDRSDSVQAAPKPPLKPITYQGGDGKTYVQPVDDAGLPTGSPTALVGTGATPKPTEVNGQYGYWKPGPDGAPTWVAVDAPQKPAAGPRPEGLARPEFSAGELSKGMRSMIQQLDQWVQQAPDERTREARKQEAADIVAQEHTAATLYLNEQQQATQAAGTTFSTQVSQRGQDASMVNARTSAGASMANQAVGTLLPLLRHAQSGAGDPVAALSELMGMMRGNVGSMGGLVDLPSVGVPSLLAPYAGQAGPSATGTNVVGGPAAGPARAVAPQAVAPPAPAQPAAQPGTPSVTVHISGNGVSNTTDAGGVPREYTPASVTRGTGLPPASGPPNVPAPLLSSYLESIEKQMADDPRWGLDDLGLIQGGMAPTS